MRYFFINYVETVGGNEHVGYALVTLADWEVGSKIDPRDMYFNEFYGKGTCKISPFTWADPDGKRTVESKEVKELSREHYVVLKQYLPH